MVLSNLLVKGHLESEGVLLAIMRWTCCWDCCCW